MSVRPLAGQAVIGGGGGGSVDIGSSIASGTAGSVLFLGAGPVLAQDNANFQYDSVNTQLLGANGDATNPFYGFINDTDTGMYLLADGQLAFTTAGTIRAYIDSTNLQISVPTVCKAINATVIDVDQNTVTDNNYLAIHAGESAAVSAAGSGRFRWHTSNTIIEVSQHGGAYIPLFSLNSSYLGGAVITYDGTNAIDISADGIAETVKAGLLFSNDTAATAGGDEYSPAIQLDARGWDGASSETHQWRIYNAPFQDSGGGIITAERGCLAFEYNQAGGGWQQVMQIFWDSGSSDDDVNSLFINGGLSVLASPGTPATSDRFLRSGLTFSGQNLPHGFYDISGQIYQYTKNVQTMRWSNTTMLANVSLTTTSSSGIHLGGASARWDDFYTIGSHYHGTTAVQNLNGGDYSILDALFVLLENTGGGANQAILPSNPSDGRYIIPTNVDTTAAGFYTTLERGGTDTITAADGLLTVDLPPGYSLPLVFDTTGATWEVTAGYIPAVAGLYTTGGTTTQSSLSGTPAVLTTFSSDGAAAGIALNTTEDAANNRFAILVSGLYWLSFNVAFNGAASTGYTFEIFTDTDGTGTGAPVASGIKTTRTIGTSAAVGAAGAGCHRRLTAGTFVDLRVSITSGVGTTVDVVDCNFSLHRVA